MWSNYVISCFLSRFMSAWCSSRGWHQVPFCLMPQDSHMRYQPRGPNERPSLSNPHEGQLGQQLWNSELTFVINNSTKTLPHSVKKIPHYVRTPQHSGRIFLYILRTLSYYIRTLPYCKDTPTLCKVTVTHCKVTPTLCKDTSTLCKV